MRKENSIALYLTYIFGGKGWFVSREFRSLFEIELQTGNCKLLSGVPYCDGIENTYEVRYKRNKSLFLFPNCKGPILIYDTEKQKYRELRIPGCENQVVSVNDVHVIRNKVYAVCAGLDVIVEMDDKEILGIYKLGKGSVGYSVLVGCKIICAKKEDAKIIEFDVQTGEIEVYSIQNVSQLGNIVYDGTKIWLSGYDFYIYRWDCFSHGLTDKILISSIAYASGAQGKEPLFQRCVSSRNYIWCIPFTTNCFVYIHKEGKNVNTITVGQDSVGKLSGARFRFIGIIEDRYLLVSSIWDARVFQIDMEQALVCERQILLQHDTWSLLLERKFCEGVVQEQAGGVHLANYLSYIVQENNMEEKSVVGKSGEEIYDILLRKEYN